jgi:hypothetical protein
MMFRLVGLQRRIFHEGLRGYDTHKNICDNELIAKTLLCITHRDIIDSIREQCPELYTGIDTADYDVISSASSYKFCPFADKCVASNTVPSYSDREFIITNLRTGAVLKVDMLTIHLIYHHHEIPSSDLIQFLSMRSNNE